MDTDAASLFWFLVPGVLLPAVLLIWAFRSPSPRQVRRWATSAGVVVTPSNEQQIRSQLGRGRRYRSLASFPFWWLACVRIVDADFPPVIATPAIGFTAYVLGALVAELRGPAAGPAGIRQAAFVPRRVSDYRPAWLRALTGGLLGAAALLAVVGWSAGGGGAPYGNRAVALVVACAVAGVAEVAVHRIVGRPQRGIDPDVLAADEGLRASGVSLAAGAALLTALWAVDGASTVAAPDPTGWWALVSMGWRLALQAAGFGVLCLIVRQETWGYRRRPLPRVTGVPV